MLALNSLVAIALPLLTIVPATVYAGSGDCHRRSKLAIREEVARAGLEKRVDTPTNLAPGTWTIDDGCARYRAAVSGDTCDSILAANSDLGTSLSLFYTINPDVDNQCSNLKVGAAYCLGLATPANIPAGTLTVQKGCIKYYTVKSGDYCEAIVTANSNVGLTLSQFYAANPAVNSQCTNLAVSSSYCVGVQAMPSVLAKSAAKKTTVGIPLPPTTSKPRLAVRTNAV